jgi:asparagine synthase (glutamine-hydrolysing)
MCGIVGELRAQAGPLSPPDVFDGLVDRMRRRGPDSRGTWTDGERCQLGFRRLSILDLSPSGDQPMRTPDGRYVLVFNGEVYNFRELRQDLEARGVQFRSSGDTEVVLQAIATWWTAAIDRFNGMFALACYDVQEGRFLAARDHAGIKPLYLLAASEGLAFGSQYDQVIQHPWARGQRARPEALVQYLRHGAVPPGPGIIEGTEMLPPGTWIEVRPGGVVRRHRYTGFETANEPFTDRHEYLDALDDALRGAVGRQLVSDVPIATLLSGGIDSPLVTALAGEIAGSDLTALTAGSGDRHDETADARRYAEAIGVHHVIEDLGEYDAVALLDQAAAAATEPMADHSLVLVSMACEAASRHATVLLTGDGGDELFWGYAGRFASVLHVAPMFRAPRSIRRLRRAAGKVVPRWGVAQGVSYPSIGDWYREKHSRMRDDAIVELFPDLRDHLADPLFDFDGSERDDVAMWMRQIEFDEHLHRVLLKVDRGSMWRSVEVRVPLLDREVIDVALRGRWEWCLDLDTGRGKLPLRDLLARHVPTVTTAKRGFDFDIDRFTSEALTALAGDELLSRDSFVGIPVDRTAMRRLWERRDLGCGRAQWTLLMLARWEQLHWR